jgi:hypothetical protein
MTQEEKDLLLKDLCARLPYGVIGQCEIDASYDTSFDTIFQTHKFDTAVYGLKEDFLLVTPLIEDNDEQEFANEEVADGVYILDFKPYLFPLSSMNDEQKKAAPFESSLLNALINGYISLFEDEELTTDDLNRLFDWLNKNHFDYRGLIEKGLAIDCTNLNVY